MRRLRLRNFMPIGLYGRAALILILPVVTLLVVVSVGFVQRYFEDVTQQLTGGLRLEIRHLAAQVNSAPDPAAARAAARGVAGPLELQATLAAAPPEGGLEDRHAFYDFSGRVIISMLREALPGLRAVDLATHDRRVVAYLDTDHGLLRVEAPRTRASARNPHQLLVLMISVGLVMILVAYVFLRNQLRPIKKLAEAAEAFGKGRPKSYRPRGAREVRAAGRAFLDMRARIERQIEQRTLLLSGVSHDLRTPLTRLKLGLSMLEPSPDTAALKRDVADMERLIDAFLNFVREDMRDEPEPTDAAAMMRRLVERARQDGTNVTLAEAQTGPPAMLRAGLLARGVDNLLSNAGRYAGRAELRLEQTAEQLVVTVEDDGPGIPPDRREAALRPFVRLDVARNQDTGSGMGLGLTIAADAARSHGGRLELGESARLGGLRVEMVIPL